MLEPKLQLPKLFSDGCVLQQGEETRIWGFSAPLEEVRIELQGQKLVCTADGEGRWQGQFAHLLPGGPFVLKAWAKQGEEIAVRDVYVGEVFLCCGQSNIELPMNRVKDRYPEEFQRPGEPLLRIYKIKEHYEFQGPLKDHVEAGWKGCSPEALGDFSAVSYFLGRFLLEERKAPIGVITASLGGSAVEAWMAKEALLPYPQALKTLEKYQNEEFLQKTLENNEKFQQAWYDNIEKQDIGWEAPEVPWKEIRLPGYLKDAGLSDFCGSVWFKKRFFVPESMAGKEAKLWLGTMVDSDKTYVNGIFVGETTYQYPPRKYEIPAGLLKSGENEIRIRLICDNGRGRVTPGKAYELFTENERISLEGVWEYRVGSICSAKPEYDFVTRKPTALYNGMLSPCIPYTLKGAVWYQGESNDERPDSYGDLLRRMISHWREQWGQKRLPFVVAQLPKFDIDLTNKKEAWAKIREQQAGALVLPDVAVTVNLDLGESNDLHPLDKKDVAWRMALAVRGLCYGEPVVFQGPVLVSADRQDNQVALTFETYDGQDLMIKKGAGVEAIELAGADGRYHPVQGRVEGKQAVVWSREAEKPEYVRYAFSDAPEQGLLYNQAGLPALPFRIKFKDNHSYL